MKSKNPFDRSIEYPKRESKRRKKNHENIIFENEKERNSVDTYIKNEFGVDSIRTKQEINDEKRNEKRDVFNSNCDIPKLDFLKFVEYRIPKISPSTQITCQEFSEIIEVKEEVIPMTITLKGNDVLTGLTQCLQYDIIAPTLPKFLENIHSSGRNTFYWDDKCLT